MAAYLQVKGSNPGPVFQYKDSEPLASCSYEDKFGGSKLLYTGQLQLQQLRESKTQ